MLIQLLLVLRKVLVQSGLTARLECRTFLYYPIHVHFQISSQLYLVAACHALNRDFRVDRNSTKGQLSLDVLQAQNWLKARPPSNARQCVRLSLSSDDRLLTLYNYDHSYPRPNHIHLTSSLHHQINQTFPLWGEFTCYVCGWARRSGYEVTISFLFRGATRENLIVAYGICTRPRHVY